MTESSESSTESVQVTADVEETTVEAPPEAQARTLNEAVDDSGEDRVESVDDAAEHREASAASDTAGSSSSAVTRLEEEGDIAADYVEELLDISDIDGDIDIEVRNGRTYVSVIAQDGDNRLRDLVGRDGKGLEALQELVRLAVLSATGNRSRLVLDVAGHRMQRAGELEHVAQEAAEQVRRTSEPVHLEPMGAYERKVVHDVIAEAGLVSESEGEGSRRHVVVSTGE